VHYDSQFRPGIAGAGSIRVHIIFPAFTIGLASWLVPFEITFRQAAAAPESQSSLLIGTVVMLPLVLAYTGHCYISFEKKHPMRPLTKNQQQWKWFFGLWCGGRAAVLVLAKLIRPLMQIS
jgi:hypothetical protein